MYKFMFVSISALAVTRDMGYTYVCSGREIEIVLQHSILSGGFAHCQAFTLVGAFIKAEGCRICDLNSNLKHRLKDSPRAIVLSPRARTLSVVLSFQMCRGMPMYARTNQTLTYEKEGDRYLPSRVM